MIWDTVSRINIRLQNFSYQLSLIFSTAYASLPIKSLTNINKTLFILSRIIHLPLAIQILLKKNTNFFSIYQVFYVPLQTRVYQHYVCNIQPLDALNVAKNPSPVNATYNNSAELLFQKKLKQSIQR